MKAVCSKGIVGMSGPKWESLDALKSMADGIQNGTVILRVANKLKLRENPDFVRPKPNGYSDAEIVEIVGKKVFASLRRGTRLIDVGVKDKSPELAQKLTQTFIDEFQSLIQEQNKSISKAAKDALAHEVEEQLVRVEAAEDKLQEFREKNAGLSLEERREGGGGTAEKKLDELNRLLSAAVNETIKLQSEFEQLKSIPEGEEDRILEIGDHGKQEHIQKLLTAHGVAKTLYYQTREGLGENNPKYLDAKNVLDGLNEQLKEMASKIAGSIEKSLQRARENEKQMQQAVQDQRLHLLEIAKLRKEYTTLKRSVDTAYSTYQSLLDRMSQTDVTDGIDETVIRVFSEPLVPTKPVSPRKKVTVALAGAFGTFLGLGVVVGLGLLDRRMFSRSQVESTLGLAVMCEIPSVLKKNWALKDTIIVTSEPFSLVSEGIRSLRTALSAHSPRSVLITSAAPGEGKSFCSANLAVLQANMGYRTLLVDADFRKPKMAEIFTDPLHGNPKAGALATQNICQETIHENLYLISCGRFTANVGEPMNGEHFAAMLWEAYASFDCVIIDTSPVGAVSDGLDYARHVDAVVVVVRSGETLAGPARETVSELKRMRAPIVGCVLNGVVECNKTRDAYVSDSIKIHRQMGAHQSVPGSNTMSKPAEQPAESFHTK